MCQEQMNFFFEYDDDDCLEQFQPDVCNEVPVAVKIMPDPHVFHDEAILIGISILTQVLTQRHGLERASQLIEEARYGRLRDGAAFSMKWTQNVGKNV